MKLSLACKQKCKILGMAALFGLIAHFSFVGLNPNWVSFREAQVLFKQERWEEAAALYEKIISEGLVHPEAYLNLAKSYAHLNNLPLAVRAYKEYLILKPNDQWAKREYAGALTGLGDYEDAEGVYKSLLEVP